MRSKAGVPWSVGIEALNAEEVPYYINRLAEDWIKDKKRVSWASEQEGRTQNDPSGFMLLASNILFGNEVEELLVRPQYQIRAIARVHNRAYQNLKKEPIEAWINRVEPIATHLADMWAADPEGDGRGG